VSPHNILIGCDGRSRLTDFGIAKAEDRIQTTRTHEVKGKLAYLAPERVDKRRLCTLQSDVFSMAVVLWECFAGRRLFRGDEAVDVLQEVIGGHIPTLTQIGAQIPPALDDVIARALSRDLDTRYATALEFARAIERAAGPSDTGTSSDVARLMEAVFATRMALRQEQVRAAVGSADLEALLRESGLPSRDPVLEGDAPDVPNPPPELAPPVPTGRYVGEARPPLQVGMFRSLRISWWSVVGVGGGVAVGVLVTLALVASHGRPAAFVHSPQARATPASAPAASARRIVVPLPFLSTRVTVDEDARDLDPPSDVVVVDLPPSAGPRHRVSALAVDGTRAEGGVREDEGIARPEGTGYTFTLAPHGDGDDARRVGRGVRVRPVGTVRNGFTKLR
jgi:serine/threonine-protein kinase